MSATTASTSYASDLLGRLKVAEAAIGSALSGLNRLSDDEFRHLDERYLDELFAAQSALGRARRAVLAPLTPAERVDALDG